MKRKEPELLAKPTKPSQKPKPSKHIPRDEFFLKELSCWFQLQNNNWLTGTDLSRYDTLILPSTDERPSIIGIEKAVKLNHKPRHEFFTYNNLKVQIFEPLNSDAIQNRDLGFHELNKHGFYHHQALCAIWIYLNDNFEYFLRSLKTVEYAKEASADSELKKAVLELKKIQTIVGHAKANHQGLCIPDLYTYSKDTSLMSFDKIFIKGHLDVKDKSQLYVYGFSHATSRAFSDVLREFFQEKIAEIEVLLGEKSIQKVKKQAGNYNVRIPGKLNERIDLVESILGIEMEKAVKSHSVNVLKNREAGELLVIILALKKIKMISSRNDNYYIALCLALLSGKSYHTYYNKLSKSGKLNFTKVFGKQDRTVVQKSLSDTANRLATAIREITIDFQ